MTPLGIPTVLVCSSIFHCFKERLLNLFLYDFISGIHVADAGGSPVFLVLVLSCVKFEW